MLLVSDTVTADSPPSSLPPLTSLLLLCGAVCWWCHYACHVIVIWWEQLYVKCYRFLSGTGVTLVLFLVLSLVHSQRHSERAWQVSTLGSPPCGLLRLSAVKSHPNIIPPAPVISPLTQHRQPWQHRQHRQPCSPPAVFMLLNASSQA